MSRKIEISHRTIIFTVLFLLGLWFLFQIRQIILVLFVAVILMSALNSPVARLENLRLPRWLAILFLYFLILGVIGVTVGVVIPPLIDQTVAFINRTTFYLKDIRAFGFDANFIASQVSQLGPLSSNLLRVTLGFFSNLVGIVFLLVVTFYLLLERKNLKHYLLILFGEGGEKRAEEFVDKIEMRLGGWVRGEAVLMSIIGLMTYIGLRILGIEYALPLAILAGLLEVIPNIGPIISAVPAVLLGLTISPIMGLAVAALYFLIQQLENTIIVPKVMEKAVGVNPLVVILSLAIGFKLAGVVGAILAMPVVLVIQVVVREFFASEKFQNL